MSKKITRGVSEEFAKAFIKDDLYKLYTEHSDELIVGVRNNYLNLYYNCDSIAKIKHTKGHIVCEIDRYYLDGKHYNSKDKEKRCKIDQKEICIKYEKIKKFSNKKATPEKKVQSKLFILNNQNPNSNWYCLDLEYVKAFRNQTEKNKYKFNARFDIIAIHKQKPHRVALIELKYGSGAIGGNSGVRKHVKDFKEFSKQGFYESHLKGELIEILKSINSLNIHIPFKVSNAKELLPPEFYFITLDNNAKKKNGSTPKQTMAGYLFKEKRWGCKKLSTKTSVEEKYGDITKKNNDFHATLLFSKETLDNIKIDDIIDGNYDERILPV